MTGRRFVSGVVYLTAVCLTLGGLTPPAGAATEYRHKMDIRNNTRVFVVAYEALTYAVNGGTAVAVPRESYRKVDLTGISASSATVSPQR